jgi:hypothetical protein
VTTEEPWHLAILGKKAEWPKDLKGLCSDDKSESPFSTFTFVVYSSATTLPLMFLEPHFAQA